MKLRIENLQAEIAAKRTELEAAIGNDAATPAGLAKIKELSSQLNAANDNLDAVLLAQKAIGRTASPANQNVETQTVIHYDASAGDRLGAAQRNFNHYLRRARAELEWKPGDPAKQFRSFGENLKAIASYYMGGRDPGTIDQRLVRAPTGAAETDPASGGFLVQTDFSTAIFMRAYEMGEILQRVQKLTISSGSNSITIPGIDETSRATGSRWGGVQSFWLAEGNAPTTSKPKFRLIKIGLNKLMSLMYTTDELLADQSVLTGIAGMAFSEEIMFMTEDAIFEGTGAGQPLGIMNAPCKVSIAKETGQATKTIVYENILNMWSRMWSRSRKDAVWFINQDIEPQLYALSKVIGTAGVPVYLPANGISGQPYGTLFGRPVVPTEYNASLGTEGDILLADYSQYVLADKGGVQMANSMHVAFSTDEMVFRITYRVDGQPIWNSALTPFKGTATKSPFITLAAR